MEYSAQSTESLPLDIVNFHRQFIAEFPQFGLIESSTDNEECIEVQDEDRPITPIETAIRKAPTTLQELKELVHRRLQIRDDIPTVKSQDQLQLVYILMSELKSVWPDISKQTLDPFLDNKSNKELERRVAVKVVTVIEDLFFLYIQKLKDANIKGVFSSSSNVSRLKTQLSNEASKHLNILKIRRKLAYQLRYPGGDDDNISEDSFVNKVRERLRRTTGLPVGRVARKLHMTRMHAEELHRAMELKELDDKIRELDLKNIPNVEAFEATLQRLKFNETRLSSEKESITDENQISGKAMAEKPTGYDEILQFRLQKSNSLPQVDTAGQFLEELELARKDVAIERKRSLDRYFNRSASQKDGLDSSDEGRTISPSEDLKNLVSKEQSCQKVVKVAEANDVISEDMSPLLQALPAKPKKTTHPLRGEMFSSDDSIGPDSDSETPTGTGNSTFKRKNEGSKQVHPQPAVVSRKIAKKNVVRTSDVRVSSRTNIAQISLQKHLPIYNSFKSEIDDVTVKRLDSNLFAGEEIKEVYEEIAKTLNQEHLQFDKDDFVVKCPVQLQATDMEPSYSFSHSVDNRVMNHDLVGRAQPPWGDQGAEEWKNSPKFGGMDRHELLQLMKRSGRSYSKGESSSGAANQRKPTKLYAAWLAWWRSTINSNDYFKYVSTEDNDFLSKIFHLYDSQDENDDINGGSKQAVEDPETIAMKQELQRRQAELEARKREYKEGYWNVNTIVLGGLGKEPELDDEQLLNEHIWSQLKSSGIAKKPDEDSSQTSSQVTLQDRIGQVWNRLKMPEKLRLDMAIKYSLDGNNTLLEQAIGFWETATECICKREELILALEKFEQFASDPNRFFEKGSKRSSLTRLEESKTRDALHKRLNALDGNTKKAIRAVEKRFKDTVTYQGRPYHEKMSVDRIEMLYWLQQERRAASLDLSPATERKSKTCELPPIATINLL